MKESQTDRPRCNDRPRCYLVRGEEGSHVPCVFHRVNGSRPLSAFDSGPGRVQEWMRRPKSPTTIQRPDIWKV
ncbi:hypothetical protein J6590_058739 [Homalodisca vitripennis]|nr:hypothetical protein J6590_058739 [Homalodisca vitripennis]